MNPESQSPKQNTQQFTNILIIMVMEQEALPLIDILQLKQNIELQNKIQLAQVYTNKINSNSINITLIKPIMDSYFNIDLVGGEIASVLVYAGITIVKPDLVINAGTAGGISDEQTLMSVGDICTPLSMQFIDREIHLPVFAKFSEGMYPVTYQNEELIKKLNIKQLKIGTTQTFSNSNKAAYEKKVNVVEMECTAISRICYQFKIPLFVLKVISDVDNSQITKDILQKDNSEQAHIANQFQENLKIVSKKLASKLVEILKHFQINQINNNQNK